MALIDLKRFELVEMLFPLRGHYFMLCDKDFAIIKKALRKVERLYTLEQYKDVIKTASTINEKFTVIKTDLNDVLNFSYWYSKFYKKDMPK